jgi:hypothetical protein
MGRTRGTFVYTAVLAVLVGTAGCARDAREAPAEVEQAAAGVFCTAPTITATRLSGSPWVQLTAQANCGGAQPEYQFLVKAPGAIQNKVVVGYAVASTAFVDAAGLAPGRNTVSVYVRPLGSTSAYDASASTQYLAGDVCSSVTLQVAASGSSVDLTASGTCTGAARPEYRFLAREPGAAGFKELRAYGGTPKASLPVPAAGRWEFMVYARAVGNLSDYESLARPSVLLGATCSAAALRVESTGPSWVGLSASATCTDGAMPEYRFAFRRPGEIAFTEFGSWTPYGQLGFSWSPAPSGRYELQVVVRASGNLSDYEAKASTSALIGNTCSAATLEASGDGMSRIDLTGGASCTAGAQGEYRFLVRRPGTTAFVDARGYGWDPHLTYYADPAVPGRYDFQVYARYPGNASVYEATASRTALAGSSCSAATLTATPREGASVVDLAAAATCRGAPAEYRFLVRKPGATAFSEARPYALDPKLALEWTGAGRYELQVQVRAAGNRSEVEASASVQSLLGKVCASASLTVRDFAGWLELDSLAACSAGATPEYRFLVRAPGSTTYEEAAPWGPSPHLPFPPRANGRHDFRVLVRAAGNASDSEASAAASASAGSSCGPVTLSATWDRGSAVQLMATSSCTMYAYPEYQYLVRPPGSATWQELQPYTGAFGTGYWLPPGASGKYEFRVQARAVGNVGDYDAADEAAVFVGASCPVATISTSPTASNAVRVSADAVCTGGSPEYRFLVRPPGAATFVEARPYSPDPLLDFVAGAVAGRFEFQVQVRAGGNRSDAEGTASIPTLIGPACTSAALAGAYDGGGSVVLDATAVCAGPAEYQFAYRPPGYIALQSAGSWGPEAKLVLPVNPGWKGTYEFQVFVRVAGNTSGYEARAATGVPVGPTCPVVTLAATPQYGYVDLVALATCAGAVPPEYRFLVRSPGTTEFVEAVSWTPNPQIWAPVSMSQSGRFEFQVQARALGNSSAFESAASAGALVGPTCSAVSVAGTYDQRDPSSGLRIRADATCAYPAAEYRFLVRAPGAAKFEEARPYAMDPSLTIPIPNGSAGRYEVIAYARLQGNRSDYEATARTSVLAGPTCDASALTAATPGGGRLVSLQAASSCSGYATPEYRFLFRPPGAASYDELRGWDRAPLATLDASRLGAGRYDFQLQVRATGNPSDWESTARATALVGTSCSAAELAAAPDGASGLWLSAGASCVYGMPAEYQLWIQRPGAGPELLRTWSTDPRLWFDGSKERPGLYTFRVNVRAAGNASESEATASVVRAIGPTCSQAKLAELENAGSYSHLVATAVCPNSYPEFRYQVRAPGAAAFTAVGPWSPSPDYWLYPVSGISGKYDVQVDVRAGGNASDREATATAPVFLGPACRSATLTATPNPYGAELRAAASCSSGMPEYRLVVRRPGALVPEELQPWSPNSTVTFFSEWRSGRYQFELEVRAAGNRGVDASATTAAQIGYACPTAALSATPNAQTGAIDLVASASCLLYADAEYRFAYRRAEAAAFTELTGWTMIPRAQFLPTYWDSGRYEFVVYVRARGNSSESESSASVIQSVGQTCTFAALSASADGLAINLSAAASCTGLPEYRFRVRPPGATGYTDVTGWQSWSTVTFPAPLPGRYQFRVDVRRQGNSGAWDTIAETSTLTTSTCAATGLTVRAYEDPAIMLDATASCSGTYANPEYRFLMRGPGGAAFRELRGWGPGWAQLWPNPWETGRYEFRVDVRAMGNSGDTEGSASGEAVLGPVCTSADLTASYSGGSAVELTATASCTGPSPEYRFLGRRPGETAFAELRPYASAAGLSLPLDPRLTGLYEYQVQVRRAGNLSAVEAAASSTVAVGPVCTSGALTVTPGSYGALTLTSSASCGPAAPEFKFFAKAPGAGSFYPLRGYGARGTFDFEAPVGVNGAYEFLVQVRAAGNATAAETAATQTVLVGSTCSSATIEADTTASPGYVRLDASAGCWPTGAAAEYQFLVRAPGTTTFQPLGGYVGIGRWWWQTPLGASGTYELKVYARARGNASAYESQATVPVTLP